MKAASIKAVVTVLVIAFGSIGLTRYWYANPDDLPPPLRWLGNQLISLLGVERAEAAADVELIYILCVCASLGSMLFFSASWLLRSIQRRRA